MMTPTDAREQIGWLMMDYCRNCKSKECDDCVPNEAVNLAGAALEKSEKYGWHDIQKNPEDLPEGNDHRLVLVAYKFLKDENYYYDILKAGLVKPSKYIAAWKYIQKYERRKEEEDGRDNEDR